MSLPRYVQDTVAKWTKEDFDAVTDHVLAGVTADGYLAYPYSYIIRNIGGVYDAINSAGTRVYGGAADAGGVDGADAAAVIQAAVTSLTTGGTLFFQAGTYTLTSGVDIGTKLLHITGEGYVSQIYTASNINVFYSTALVEALQFSNIKLRYSFAGAGGNLLRLTGGAAQVRFTNVIIDNSTDYTGVPIYIVGSNPYEFTMLGCTCNWGGDLIRFAGSEVTLIGNKFGGASPSRVNLQSCGYILVLGCSFEGAYLYSNSTYGGAIVGNWFASKTYDYAIRVYASYDLTITANHIYDIELAATAYGYGIQLYDSHDCVVADNHIRTSIVNTRGISENGTSNNNLIIGNHLRECTDSKMNISGAATQAIGNFGYYLEGHGSSMIPSGSTSIVVTHGLNWTPQASEITVTPTAGTTADAGQINVYTIGATQFTVGVRSDPGASNFYFNWSARKIYATKLVA